MNTFGSKNGERIRPGIYQSYRYSPSESEKLSDGWSCSSEVEDDNYWTTGARSSSPPNTNLFLKKRHRTENKCIITNTYLNDNCSCSQRNTVNFVEAHFAIYLKSCSAHNDKFMCNDVLFFFKYFFGHTSVSTLQNFKVKKDQE